MLERFGIDTTAERLWRSLLAHPSATAADLKQTTALGADQLEAAFQLLLLNNLVRHSETTPVGYAANDPESALEILAIRVERRHATEAQELAELRAAIPALADEYAGGRALSGVLPGFEIVRSLDDIRHQLYIETERSRDQLRTLVHTTKPDAALDSREVDRAALGRGIRMRTILRPEDLLVPGLHDAMQWLHERGERMRALETVPTQMQIFDDRLAVVRVDPNDSSKGAMFIRVQNLVDLLIELYERLWEDAEPLFPDGLDEPAITARQRQVLALIAAGTKDEAIARSLGVGLRTIRRDISELKDLAAARSRTDLITAAMRRGWIPAPRSEGGVESSSDQAAQFLQD